MGTRVIIFLLCIIQVQSQMFDRLYRDLFSQYNPETLPMTSLDTPVEVKIGLSLIQVKSFDPETGLAEVDTWMDTEWTDKRLRWSSEKYSNITSLRVKSDQVWTPDIELYSGQMTSTKSLVVISMDGTVFHSPKTTFSIWCDGMMTCQIKLGSWTYDGFLMDVQTRSEQVDLSNYIPRRWNVVNTTIVKNTLYFTCCPEPYYDITVRIDLKEQRRAGFSLKSYFQNIF